MMRHVLHIDGVKLENVFEEMKRFNEKNRNASVGEYNLYERMDFVCEEDLPDGQLLHTDASQKWLTVRFVENDGIVTTHGRKIGIGYF